MDADREISTDELWNILFGGLFDDGRLLLGDVGAYLNPPSALLLKGMVEQAQSDCPGVLPALDMLSLQWAAQVVGVASTLVVNRHEECAVLQRLIEDPPKLTPSSVFYADVLLQVIPDIWKLAVRRSEDDALVQMLLLIFERWPYSCIGMPNESPDQSALDVICSDRTLLVLFAERVMEREDFTWLRYQPIRKMVMEMVGDMWINHPTLIKELETYGS